MSGPKVVNIEAVRRRQKRETTTLLNSVETLSADCLRLCGEDVEKQDALEKSIRNAIARTTALGKANRWAEAIEELRAREEFLRLEQSVLRERLTARHAEKMRVAHHLEIVSSQAKKIILSLPEAESAPFNLRLDAATGNSAAIDGIIREISEKSILREDFENREELKKLVADFQPTGVVETIAPAKDPDFLRLERCWKLLGEWETYSTNDPTLIESWKQAATAVLQAPSVERRLRLDSLILELSAHLREERERDTIISELEALAVELQSLNTAFSLDFCDKIHALRHNRTGVVALRSLLTEVQTHIAAETSKSDSAEQRLVILRGLAACGYEVRLGMEAAWVEDGYVILQKPGEAGYGVEFTAPATGSSVQTRIVALGTSGRDPQRDKEVEDNWCGDFRKLRQLLESEGFSAELRHATPAGSAAIRTVSTVSDGQLKSRTEAPKLRSME